MKAAIREVIRPSEVARRLGLSRTSVWRLHRDDTSFPRFFRLGSTRTSVLDTAELTAWLDRQKTASQAKRA